MKKFLVAVALSIALVANAATPTFAQVSGAIEAGELGKAKVMMEEVLRKRPESIKAHMLNAQLLAAEGAPKEKVQAELELANKLKTGGKVVEENISVKNTEKLPENSSNKLKYILLAICGVAGIITSFLGWQFYSIKKRSKQTTIKGEENESSDSDVDPSLYTQRLSSHTS